MSLEFDCSNCRKRIRAPESLAGKKARCPQCQVVVDVPGPEPEPVYQAEEIPFAAVQPEAPAAGGERRPCPACGEPIISSALKCRYCGQLFGASAAPVATTAKRLVLSRMEAENGQLPAVCMQCGAAAAGQQIKQFSFSPSWAFLFFGVIGSMLTAKKVSLQAPFCAEHMNHWRWRTQYIFAGFGIVCVLGLGTMVLIANDAKSFIGLACGGVALAGLAWGIAAIVIHEKSIQTKEITDDTVTLVNVSPEFIGALNVHRASQPFSSAPVTSPSGSLPVVAIAAGAGFLVIVCLAAIATIGENRPPRGAVADTSPLVDPQNGFQLRHPGPGWFMLDRTLLHNQNHLAFAGAKSGELEGIILVERVDNAVEFAGNEQVMGRALMDTSPLKEKTLETAEAINLQGRRGLRIQFTARDGFRRVRVQNILLENNRRLYQIFALGPADKANRQSFQPFVDAFQLLP